MTIMAARSISLLLCMLSNMANAPTSSTSESMSVSKITRGWAKPARGISSDMSSKNLFIMVVFVLRKCSEKYLKIEAKIAEVGSVESVFCSARVKNANGGHVF